MKVSQSKKNTIRKLAKRKFKIGTFQELRRLSIEIDKLGRENADLRERLGQFNSTLTAQLDKIVTTNQNVSTKQTPSEKWAQILSVAAEIIGFCVVVGIIIVIGNSH